MSKKLNSCVFVVIGILFLFLSDSAAQEKSTAPQTSESSTKFPAAKRQATQAKAEDDDKPGNKEEEKDGPNELRKRAEWFYKQRASVKGHIPAGARVRAFQHMQQMMVAEGKLTRRADGTFAAVSSAEGAAAAFPAWTAIGPRPTSGGVFSPVSGRVTTIAVDPSDSSGNTALIGGAQGGIWRTTDGGATWTPVGDQNASLSMGSIVFAASNPAIVYAGTGEQEGIGFDIYYGAGVLKSSDHGATWTQTCTTPSATCPFIGPYDDITPFGFFTLGGTRISYVAVNPSNPQMVLVGAQEFVEGTHEGVYCSDNGGSTWTNVLPDEMSTFVGFASSTVAYAALGNPFGNSTGAPNGNGIYKATAIGSTCSTVHFSHLTAGTLPTPSGMGRIDIGIAASDTSGKTLYASIADASTGSNTNLGVYLTQDGGTTWTKTTAPDVCQEQCWYDNVVKVDPLHAGTVFLGGSAVSDSGGAPQWVVRSPNSGTSWSTVIPDLAAGSAGLPHVDNHAMAFVKLSTGKVRMYLGNDGGVWRTDDAEAALVQWTNLNNTLALTQFYPAISIPSSTPFFAIAGTQDNGTQEYFGTANWTDIGLCGDGTGTAIDALIPSSVYIACNGDLIGVSYQNGATGTFVEAVNGINPSDFLNFVPPFAADPNTANTLYLGTTKIYQSVDAANSWAPISGDLVSGGNFESLTAIALAPGAPGVVYAGSTTGELFVATGVAPGNFGNFTPVAITPRAITAIAVDPADVTGGTVYVASSGFSFVNSSVNDPMGHIFRRAGFASSWIDVSCSVANCSRPAVTDLPNIPVNDVVVDPDVPGTLYAATDLGVFIGNCSVTPCTWTTLSSGLPRVAVLSLKLHEPSRTLRAATHGRGAWDLQLNNFTFSGPHLSAITAPSPASVNSGGAQLTLTVSGSGLTGGVIQFGGTALTGTGTASDTLLSGIVPTALLTTGTPQITVKVASTTSNALPFPVLGGTPTITSITPSSTPVQANPTTNVTIQLAGTNFTSTAKVLFNGAPSGIIVLAPGSGCALPTCLKATLPASLLSPFGSTDDIVVFEAPPGGGRSAAKQFKVAAPAPPNDNIANAINITTLSFNDTQDSSNATTETTDPVPPCVIQYSSANGNTGGHPNGLYNTIWYKFTPQFSANLSLDTTGSSYDTVLSVWSGNPGSLVNVACNDDVNPGVQVQSQLSGIALTAGTTYYIMTGSFGPPDPNPVALGGRSQLNFQYNSGIYPTPTLTSISPASAKSGDPNLTITLVGSNFFSGAFIQFVDAKTFFGSGFGTTFVSPTKLTAVIPASAMALPGDFIIYVVNPSPTTGSSAALPFTVALGVYPVPNLVSIYPTTIIAGSLPFTIFASGSDFASTAVLNFNGVAKMTSINGSQNVFATISTADINKAGTVQVTVSNPMPGGGSSSPLSFVITQPTIIPTIASVNPTSFPANTPVTFTMTGTGFIQGAGVDVVATIGGGFWNANVLSSTQISISNFAVGSTGTIPIYVVDPAPAGTSTAFNLTVTQPPAPTITSVSPANAASGSSPTLTITGTGFQFGANVFLNGFSYIPNIVSSTQMSVVVSLTAAAGMYPLTVVDPAPAGMSAPFNFTVTAPPDFSITSTGTTSVTVTAGSTATFTNAIVIAGQSGFSSAVALSCSTPFNATNTHCSISPGSFASGSGTATVSVTTMARGLVPPSSPFTYFYPRPYLVPAVMSIMLALLWGFVRTRRRRLALSLPIAGLALFVALQIIGCGGGGGGSTPPPPPPVTGTPAGSYMVTVTATSGSLSHTSTLTLVVQ